MALKKTVGSKQCDTLKLASPMIVTQTHAPSVIYFTDRIRKLTFHILEPCEPMVMVKICSEHVPVVSKDSNTPYKIL